MPSLFHAWLVELRFHSTSACLSRVLRINYAIPLWFESHTDRHHMSVEGNAISCPVLTTWLHDAQKRVVKLLGPASGQLSLGQCHVDAAYLATLFKRRALWSAFWSLHFKDCRSCCSDFAFSHWKTTPKPYSRSDSWKHFYQGMPFDTFYKNMITSVFAVIPTLHPSDLFSALNLIGWRDYSGGISCSPLK